MEIELMKSLIRRFRNNRTKENWIILENLIHDKKGCIKCNGPIFYHNSLIRLSKEGKLKYDQNLPSCKSFKEIEGQRFYLSVCQDCLSKEFPEYSSLNKSRVFNVVSEITKFAFQIPSDIAKKFTQKTAVTLENFINKYGGDEGSRRWDEYCRIQSETNTFEYKKEKYGWSEEQFNEFNKSRAVTLKNMVKKYGKEEGEKIFKDYVEKQKINGKTLEWFIDKYGEKEGKSRFKKVSIEKAKGGLRAGLSVSKVSQEFFRKLDTFIGKDFKTLYLEKNIEKIIYINEISKCYMLDYFIEELNVCVEFHGDYFHANPSKYDEKFEFPGFSKGDKILTAKDIWDKDILKYSLLKEHKGIKTIVVWESDYYRNKDNENFYKKIVKECIEK
jgi:hypothetical protein